VAGGLSADNFTEAVHVKQRAVRAGVSAEARALVQERPVVPNRQHGGASLSSSPSDKDVPYVVLELTAREPAITTKTESQTQA